MLQQGRHCFSDCMGQNAAQISVMQNLSGETHPHGFISKQEMKFVSLSHIGIHWVCLTILPSNGLFYQTAFCSNSYPLNSLNISRFWRNPHLSHDSTLMYQTVSRTLQLLFAMTRRSQSLLEFPELRQLCSK